MIRLVTALLIFGAACSAHALQLKDFLFDAPAPLENRVASFADCEERLGQWPNLGEYQEIEEATVRAQDYFDRWRAAESGVDFARETVAEATAINDRLMSLLGRFDLPPTTLDVVDEHHLKVVWIQQYLGYAATFAELSALRAALDAEIDGYPPDREPSKLEKRRWMHDIMVLSHQFVLGNERNRERVDPPLELITLAAQLNLAED